MASRTRTRGALVIPTSGPNCTVVYSGSFKCRDGIVRSDTTQSGSAGRIGWDDNRASITDETGSPGAIHNCTNTKTFVQPYVPPSATFVFNGIGVPNTGSATMTVNSDLIPFFGEQHVATIRHATVPDGSAVAIARVPSMSKEVMSGLNSLYELKDCKAFLDLIPAHLIWAVARRKKAESIRELRQWLQEIKSLASSPAALMHSLVGADLMWKFGVKPLVKDIHTVHNALTSLNAATRELVSKPFSVQGRHTEVKSLRYNYQTGAEPSIFNGNIAVDYYTNKTTTKTWVFGARKRINPAMLPSFDVAKSKALAEQLGLSLDATDIWEAVPYSFVVDWFLPIQTFLEQFITRATDPSWLLTDGWWSSVKTTSTNLHCADYTAKTSANYSLGSVSNANQVRTSIVTDYQRTRLTAAPSGFPITYIPELEWPSWAQSGTGIELLLQRVKRTMLNPKKSSRI